MIRPKTKKIDFFLLLKRYIDLTVSFTIILMLSPAMLFIIPLWTIIIRDNPFSEHVKIGKNRRNIDFEESKENNPHISERRMNDSGGRPFKQYRFRNPSPERWASMGKLSKSIIIFFNRKGLSEIPLLFNVLIGDMSIVGTRPDPPWFLPGYNWFERMKFSMKPGITGFWQVYGSPGADDTKNLQLDLYYVWNASMRMDTQIIFETMVKALRK